MRRVFEFSGGPRDGEVIVAGAAMPLGESLQRLCERIQDAAIGDRIACPTLYAETILSTCSDSAISDFIDIGCRFPDHTYEVIGRRDGSAESRVKLQHVGAVGSTTAERALGALE